jgi:hypothetical protein
MISGGQPLRSGGIPIEVTVEILGARALYCVGCRCMVRPGPSFVAHLQVHHRAVDLLVFPSEHGRCETRVGEFITFARTIGGPDVTNAI